MKPPLLDRSQTDQALRDLMPIVEWLTNANIAQDDGMSEKTFVQQLCRAYAAFVAIPDNSPAIKAYIRWLEQNTAERDID